jgi:phosphoenolpyruvate carboxylase
MSEHSSSADWTGFFKASTSESVAKKANQYRDDISKLLFDCLLKVIRKRCPEIESTILGKDDLRNLRESHLTMALQAYGIWFQLLSIAQQNADVRRLRLIETTIGHNEVPGTFAQVISNAAEQGIPAERIEELLNNASINPVITAHPTEAKRVTVLEIHRRIYVYLKQLEQDRWTPHERDAFRDRIIDEIDLLWLTGEIRLEKPTVQQEVSWGIHFFKESLFQGVNELYSELEQTLKSHYPDHKFSMPGFFQFGCWIGGDRDGNPFVTNDVTLYAIKTTAKASLEYYLTEIKKLASYLSVAEHSVNLPESFYKKLNAILDRSGEADAIKSRNPGEVLRQICYCILKRLNANAYQLSTDTQQENAYPSASALAKDIKVVEEGLIAADCESLCIKYVRPFRHAVEAFGFHTVKLDLRQNSTITTQTLQEIWQVQHKTKDEPPAKDSAEWRTWLLDSLKEPLEKLPEFPSLTESSAQTIDLMRLVRNVQDTVDRDAFGVYILSMTQSSEDILGVYLLAKYAGLFTDASAIESCRIQVVPLLETIDDLRNGPAILDDLLDNSLIQRTINEMGGYQEIMVGYSDSNKDGGIVCSSWEVSKAQKRIFQAGQDKGVQVSFFHGRGGSVSRGGAPAGRAIAAQPAGTINGRMRVTEQGEVVSGKYANRGYASQQLELLAASVLSHSLFSKDDENLRNRAEYDEVMEALSGTSYVTYRGLVEHPGLVEFYSYASPVEELALMKIGSRPARRFGAASLDDLRAIPWVFAWTQNRLMVTGWYGYGSAINQFLNVRGKKGKAILAEMFEKCPLFRLITDNIEKTLFLVDLDIADEYSMLVENKANRDEILNMIKAERDLTEKMLLSITGESALCDRFPVYQTEMQSRLHGIKQVGLEQVKLVKQFRDSQSTQTASQNNLVSLLLSINCVAAGLGWTG